jgi:excisionase family DNA binding protein
MPITAADLDDLLTVEEAAAFLKVSRSTLYRMIANREVEVVRIGSGAGRPHFTEAALIESVNRKVVRAEPA